MADYFDYAVAYNPDADDLVSGATFQAFAIDDLTYTTPLAVFAPGADGAAIPALVSSSAGVLPQFRVAGDPQEIVLKSGSFVTRVTSKFGSKGEPGVGLPGKSAYEFAVEAGFTGTEEEYSESLGAIPDVVGYAVSSSPDAAPVVFHGIFAEGAEPTPEDDGKIHIGWRIPAS